MKFSKKNVRLDYRSNKRSHYSKNSYSSLSKKKYINKGNISQMLEKYINLAKEASSSGDMIQSEYYSQFADHYSRVMIEQGLKVSDTSEVYKEAAETNSNQDTSENKDIVNEESFNTNAVLEENVKLKSNNTNSEDSDSIDTVSFIAQPPKKNTKTKK